MRRNLVALVTAALVTMGGLTACTDDGEKKVGVKLRGGDGTGKVGVILPDTTTSQRWGTDDPKLLKAAFDAASVPVEIENARGDAANFQRIGDRMIAEGATVLIIANLTPESGRYVIEKARAAGVKTIDYDRLTVNGGASYYVSFDNELVGRMQGEGLVRCLKAGGKRKTPPRIAYLNGAPEDNNATLFKNGYDSVLQPKYDDGVYLKGPDQSVDRWDNAVGRTIFIEMLNQFDNKIDGVLAANDGLGNAAIKELRKRGMNGTVPVTGQDATVEGLQNILAGDQCMTVYKPIKKEADEAAKLAIDLFKGQPAEVTEQVKDPESGASVPAVLSKPEAIFKDNVGDVIKDGFVAKKTLCAGRFAKLCEQNGIK
ncbi:sugar ABC transporter substrate-binding protein [Couchioplanes caeruleus]|uniref:Sugar ABC transporter substrate-binding protein n=2 Tax=Couchioplanes caeruleus TaxID=56438 RepID=A0A1K0GGC5_9ACTN|nr:substrate-binding domain-containing protein [Couchioplanes caeruleus]OJF11230.1 sugar ABC transporter substrate-binding protein [Couchioplanes caeruleus subsp. caeruleus]OJF15967.1 sugar ABC transporter substrate-binding protein [Couchioplanes caeruleus subsp. caeruleus]ROP27817.1 D-xylose transport system substrate-binding protein [Couchioplanes caeruleus]